MCVSSTEQLKVFLICICAGIVCMSFFDLQRMMRRMFKHNRFFVLAEDVLFALVCAGVSIFVSFVFDNGEIRYYQLLGAVCGAGIYKCFVKLVKARKKLNKKSIKKAS